MNNGLKFMFKDIIIYDFFVWMYYYALRDILFGGFEVWKNIDFVYEVLGFLFWYRVFLLLWE